VNSQQPEIAAAVCRSDSFGVPLVLGFQLLHRTALCLLEATDLQILEPPGTFGSVE